jgi:signal transduction histidine kinase
VSFVQREQALWRSHLRRYATFFATAALLLGAGAALFFTYRAAAREMEASRMKSEFVASVSHEFRTPLSAIDALLERLESGKVRDEEMLRRYYKASRQEVQRLTGMVNQLLDLSRLNEGRKEFSFGTINLNRLAEDAISRPQPRVRRAPGVRSGPGGVAEHLGGFGCRLSVHPQPH